MMTPDASSRIEIVAALPPMMTEIDRLLAEEGVRRGWMYSPFVQPLLRSLQANLADIDFTYESGLEAVKNSPTDEALKQAVVGKLQQHRERRFPCVRQRAALQERIRAKAAWSEIPMLV
jgi:hypothetical protein